MNSNYQDAMIAIEAATGVHVAGVVPRLLDNDNTADSALLAFDEQKIFGRSIGKEMSLFIQYALYASQLALSHANLHDFASSDQFDKHRCGVAIASGTVPVQRKYSRVLSTMPRSH